MEQGEAIETYLRMLNESLQHKIAIMNQIYDITQQQNLCLQEEKDVVEVMERCVTAKEPLIEQLIKLDDGFDLVYSKIKDYVSSNINKHKPEIASLQASITVITSLSVKVQALEQSNKRRFEQYLVSKKKDIKQFQISNRTASNYYKNMTGNMQGESYFIDKKK